MLTFLISLAVALIIVVVVVLVLRALIPLLGMPEPINYSILLIVGLIAFLTVLEVTGLYHLPWGR